jgi:hypothetical protein
MAGNAPRDAHPACSGEPQPSACLPDPQLEHGTPTQGACRRQTTRPRGEILLPYALSPEGRLVTAEAADRGVVHRCQACASPLTLRRGAKKRPHFAHRLGANCSPETALHFAAKHLIAQVVKDWIAARAIDSSVASPSIRRTCPGCGESRDQSLPPKVTDAVVEHRLTSGRIVDVCLLDERREVCAVEVFKTHEVDVAKAASLSMPWLELAADAVVENPMLWLPLQDHLCPLRCRVCAERDGVFVGAVARAERERKQERESEEVFARARERRCRGFLASVGCTELSPAFDLVLVKCWYCKEMTAALSWPQGERSRTEPPKPRPRTIVFLERQSNLGFGGFWVNRCHRCCAPITQDGDEVR